MSGNLTGTLTDGASKGLQQFGAARNQLTGTIPTELIRDSRMLNSFNVPYNQFTCFDIGYVTAGTKFITIDDTHYGRPITE